MWSSVFPLSSQELKDSDFSSTTQVVLEYLRDRGASFFTDIVENTRLLRSQVEESLAELVANGVVVSDSFTGLRARGGVTVDATWARGKLASATLRPAISGAQRLRVPANTTVATIHSGDVVVAFRQSADGVEVPLEAGRSYEVSFR